MAESISDIERNFVDNHVHKKGIDVSHYNEDSNKGKPPKKPISWAQVLKQMPPHEPIRFTYIKVSEGKNTQDKWAQKHAQGASKYKLPLGYYHLAHPGLNSPEEEVDNFIQSLHKIAIKPSLSHGYALDLEINEKKISSGEYLEWVESFFSIFLMHFKQIPNPKS